MKPWEFRARKLANRKWLCGDFDDDTLWNEDGEMMLVWRFVGDDEKMKQNNHGSNDDDKHFNGSVLTVNSVTKSFHMN